MASTYMLYSGNVKAKVLAGILFILCNTSNTTEIVNSAVNHRQLLEGKRIQSKISVPVCATVTNTSTRGPRMLDIAPVRNGKSAVELYISQKL